MKGLNSNHSSFFFFWTLQQNEQFSAPNDVKEKQNEKSLCWEHFVVMNYLLLFVARRLKYTEPGQAILCSVLSRSETSRLTN